MFCIQISYSLFRGNFFPPNALQNIHISSVNKKYLYIFFGDLIYPELSPFTH